MILGTIFRNSFGRTFKEFAVVTMATSVSISGFSAADSSSYLRMASSITGDTIADLFGNGDSSEVSKDSNSASNLPRKIDGLNFSLIDKIPDVKSGKKGFIKEVLSLGRDASNKKLLGKPLPAETIYGIWYSEVGYDNEDLPDYYFKPSKWRKDDKNYSIAGFTYNSKVTNSQMSLERGGHGFNESLNASTKCKAKVDPVNNTRRNSNGDAAFAPDAVMYVYNKAESILKMIDNSDSVSKCWVSGLCNNRGSINQQLAGVAYSREGSSKSAYNWDKYPKKILREETGALSKAYESFVSNGGVPGDGSAGISQTYCAAVAITLHCSPAHEQWFINKTAKNYLLGHKYVDIYQKLFPKSKSESIKKELEEHVADSLKNSIKKINPSFSGNTQRIYKTSSDYQDCPYYTNEGGVTGRSYGYVWYVSKQKDTYQFYKHGQNANFVMAFDGITFRYTYNTSILGRYLFAKLLKQAGVDDVDPTNPDTYFNMTEGSYSATGSDDASFDKKAKKVLSTYKKINWSKLSTKRMKVLKEAVNVAYSKKYVYELNWRSLPTHEHKAAKISSFTGFSRYTKAKSSYKNYKNLKYPVYGLDCSGFIYHCYQSIDSTFPNGVAKDYHDSSLFTTISRGDFKPGDIAVKYAPTGSVSGHIVILVSKVKTGYETLEASETGTFVGEKINTSVNNSIYIFRKYKGIDK